MKISRFPITQATLVQMSLSLLRSLTGTKFYFCLSSTMKCILSGLIVHAHVYAQHYDRQAACENFEILSDKKYYLVLFSVFLCFVFFGFIGLFVLLLVFFCLSIVSFTFLAFEVFSVLFVFFFFLCKHNVRMKKNLQKKTPKKR